MNLVNFHILKNDLNKISQMNLENDKKKRIS